MSELTHFDSQGRARMVDIGSKSETERSATARAHILMAPETRTLALSGTTRKGDVLRVAELAGIMAAKRTADLIPLCHPLPLSGIELMIGAGADDTSLQVTARVRTTGRTGVEMEALTAVSAACLTVYDMLKSVDRGMVINGIELLEKTGGKSGDYRKDGA